jgi:hypothetical protein
MDSTAASDAERAFKAKYGDALRPKPRLIATDVKHFDSADWAMRKSVEEARKRDAGTTAATANDGGATAVGTMEDSAREVVERGAHTGDATSTREGNARASEGADG